MAGIIYDYSPKYSVDAHNVHKDLSEYMLVDGFDFVLDIDKSGGIKFIEARSGKAYFDFFTCFASMPVGMNHPKMLDEEFIKYLGVMALNKPSNSDIYTESMATFVKTFFKTAVPDYFKYSFFIDGGALAVENALKAAFDWKVRKNMRKNSSAEKGHKIIHFREAFHGRSGYTMSLTNTDPNKVRYFPKFDWPRVTNPKLKFPITAEVLAEVEKLERQAESEIKEAFRNNPDDIAAIIIEPIQGEGGDNHFRPEFFRMLRNLADENDALLIFDEVQTGVGITGKWWAHQHMGIEPDIMAFGKKMQVCGILAGPKLDEEPDNVFKVSSRINSTWGGNLVDMVRSTKYLEIIEEEKLVDNAAGMGAKLIEKLVELEYDYPELVSNVRGQGLFCAFDMPDADVRSKLISGLFEEGLIILPCGPKSIRFRPPLNITSDELDNGMKMVTKAVKNLKK
ncbi:MAG: L-lysine 6-transaminase [Candidatus Kapaibacterium sp.]